jgi:hypothetical protein
MACRFGCEAGSGVFDISEALKFFGFVSSVLCCSLGDTNSLCGFRIVYFLGGSLFFSVSATPDLPLFRRLIVFFGWHGSQYSCERYIGGIF